MIRQPNSTPVLMQPFTVTRFPAGAACACTTDAATNTAVTNKAVRIVILPVASRPHMQSIVEEQARVGKSYLGADLLPYRMARKNVKLA
jgi:hypothetical protein